MVKKRIAIICCFETYQIRVSSILKYFKSKDYEVDVLHSNFKHSDKSVNYEIDKKYITIPVPKYSKNMSIKRLYSHYKFSRDVYKKLLDSNYTHVYAIIPPNYLAFYMTKLKTKRNIKLYFDLMDIWPETMPFDTFSESYPLKFWKNKRDKYLKYADHIVFECNLFKTNINTKDLEKKSSTIYLAKDVEHGYLQNNFIDNDLRLCYLGSINNIIDIDFIIKFMEKLSVYKNVILDIVGDGEKRSDLLEALNNRGLSYNYHGKVYDKSKLLEILSRCHFGMNVMKKSVKVGLTMKSIDYLYFGLPLINNIYGDTSEMIDKYKIGYNVFDVSDFDFNNMLENSKNFELQNNVSKVFNELFTFDKYKLEMEKIFGKD